MRLTEGLPDEAGLRRVTRRAAVVGSVVAAVSLLVIVLALRGGLSTQIAFTTITLMWSFAFPASLSGGPAAEFRDNARREIVLAGTRERRRQIRHAVIRGRTGSLSVVDQRILVDWARLARVRTHLETLELALLSAGVVFLGGIALVRFPVPWVGGVVVALGILGSVLGANARRESRAVRRFLAEHDS